MSAITPPKGFLTRPEAAKKFNRSQRQLERDLDVAYLADDNDTLAHFKLLTKDGEVREAKDVKTEQVKELQTAGMIPTWYVDAAFLEQKYGRKGESRPAKSRVKIDSASARTGHVPKEEYSTWDDSDASHPSVQADAHFLYQRINTLERQNQEERERHDRIVARLFEQLDVKDKQISAWDEVTQGLTKGLATGRLAPRLLSPDNRSTNSVVVSEPLPPEPRPADSESELSTAESDTRSVTEPSTQPPLDRNDNTGSAHSSVDTAAVPPSEDSAKPSSGAADPGNRKSTPGAPRRVSARNRKKRKVQTSTVASRKRATPSPKPRKQKTQSNQSGKVRESSGNSKSGTRVSSRTRIKRKTARNSAPSTPTKTAAKKRGAAKQSMTKASQKPPTTWRDRVSRFFHS